MKRMKYSNIYIALFVSLLAVGVGTVVSLRSSKPDIEVQPEESFRRITVEWSDPEDEPLTDKVNAAVTGIEDERTQAAATEKAKQPDFRLPMGKDIIKDFSDGEMVRSATMGDWRVHNGVDFGGSAGNDVIAAADGTVISVTDDSFWGGIAEIDHGNGITVKYCGLAFESCPKEGTQVKQGDKIASLGTIPIEAADGDHLHIEVTVNNKTADPLEVLNIAYEE